MVEDVMQELAGLPDQRLLRFEDEGFNTRGFCFSGRKF
jgi:hypothetical protein